MSKEQRKVVDFNRHKKGVKKSFKSKFKDYLKFCADDIRYGTGRIFLALIILCLLVIAVMLLNRARAHMTVDIDNRLNVLYEQAETYNESDMGEYESIISDDIRATHCCSCRQQQHQKQ